MDNFVSHPASLNGCKNATFALKKLVGSVFVACPKTSVIGFLNIWMCFD